MNLQTKPPEVLDRFTAEITRMALESISDEMATTMKLTSGSPVLTEGQDFSTALLTPEGEHITYAGYVTVHIGSSWLGTRLVMKAYPPEKIKPGDQFLSNDPYRGGACHAADNYVVKPIFVDGELVCWAYSGAHILDVGGADPGGWSPASFDMFGEAIHIPPLKIVKEGQLNQDLCTVIENNVRLPRLYINDVKSFIAANNTADQRIADLVRAKGIEAFRKICAFNQDLSEKMMRERISNIPDGAYETVDWVEHDGHNDILFNVRCKLTVSGSDLKFDFSGSDPQGRGGMNAAPAGLIGGVWTALVQILAYDIPFNAGVMRPVQLDRGEEGTLTNPKRPAATGAGHIDTGAKASKMVTELLSRAFAESDDLSLRARISGQFQDCFSANVWEVTDQYGRPTLIANMDSGGAGGPAQTCCDGLDAAAMMCQVNNQLPDVESNENLYPMLYLWKRLQVDSGGPGAYRGGLGLDFAWALWGTTDVAHGMLNACTRSVPPRGVLGGMPPSTSRFAKLQTGPAEKLFAFDKYPTSETLGGVEELLPAKAFPIELGQGELFIQWCGGGSGLGDPLLREPMRVYDDVIAGYVSTLQAEKAYGVMLDGAGNLDAQATEHRRTVIRRARLGREPKSISNTNSGAKGTDSFSSSLEKVTSGGSESVRCRHCETLICEGDTDWRSFVVQRESDLADHLGDLGIWVQARDPEPLAFVERICPGCGIELENAVMRPAADR